MNEVEAGILVHRYGLEKTRLAQENTAELGTEMVFEALAPNTKITARTEIDKVLRLGYCRRKAGAPSAFLRNLKTNQINLAIQT